MSESTQSEAGGKGLDRVVIDIAIRLVILGLIVYWSLLLVGPFIPLMLWGVVLTVALFPIFAWLKARLWGRGSLAAVLVTVGTLLIVIGPAGLLATALVENLRELAVQVQEGSLQVPPPAESVQDWPLVGERLYQLWSLASSNLAEAVERVGPELKSLGRTLLSAAAGIGLGILLFAVSVIIAGFLFAPAEYLNAGVRTFARRVMTTRGERFVDLAGATIRNVARGVIGIAMLQSLVIGTGLLVAGVPGAGLIAFGALILAIVQIGPAILVLGTIIWAWTSLSTLGAVLFTAYMIPATLLDNVLKPIVMSRGLEVPMLVILVGVMGGTLAHGIIGLFLGPIVLAVAYDLLLVWAQPDPRHGSDQPDS